MARTRRTFTCSSCEYSTVSYQGRCPSCGEWNSFVERLVASVAPTVRALEPSAQLSPLSTVDSFDEERLATSIPEFDRVLGGGLVPGSLVLVGGEPGVGKSTLMLQAAAALSAAGSSVVYTCGEESLRQVRLRADRLGLANARVDLLAETGIEMVLSVLDAAPPAVLIIDSIQSVHVESVESRAGGPAQLAEAGMRLLEWAKRRETAVLITGHVTKTGEVAGPRLLEHLVDAVLYFESAEHGSLRVLRATKNRFGATDEVGVFEMTGEGLQSLENPSSAFLESRGEPASGCAVTATVEGSRALCVELQALAVATNLAAPRRIASGMEVSRLHLLLAVLARRAGLASANLDIVATVSGGLRIRDPAADMATAAALASAIIDRPVARGTAFLGEVALSGSLRPVDRASRRLAELARLGFDRCIAPPGVEGEDIHVMHARTLREALDMALRLDRRV